MRSQGRGEDQAAQEELIPAGMKPVWPGWWVPPSLENAHWLCGLELPSRCPGGCAGAERGLTRGWCSVFQHNMPFWRISCHADLEALRHALELEYL